MLSVIALNLLAAQLELSDALRAGRDKMLDPQDLPGRYGRVVRALDRLLEATGCEAVVAGGWAVWRHGFLGRVTQDVDIVVPAARIEEFLRVAPLGGFDVLPTPAGLWPKLLHEESGINVDLLPEGATPGTAAHPRRPRFRTLRAWAPRNAPGLHRSGRPGGIETRRRPGPR